jgi:hypothetical protein
MSLARFSRPLLAGIAILAVGTGATNAPAQADAPDLGQTVAMALATAHSAQSRPDHERLVDALAVIDHSGARPLPDWNGLGDPSEPAQPSCA